MADDTTRPFRTAPSENQRAALTRRLVRKALLALLADTDIRRISIRSLCEAAGINRSTFYNHYGSQYDVLCEMVNLYLDDIGRTIEAADNRDRQSVHRRVALVMRYMADNLFLTRLLLRQPQDADFVERLFALPKIGEMLAEATAGMDDPGERDSACAFALHGSYKLLRDWINREKREAPEEAAGRILGLARRICAGDHACGSLPPDDSRQKPGEACECI